MSLPTETDGTTTGNFQNNIKYAVVGSLGGLFSGITISAIANAASAIPPTINNSIATPFTFILLFAGAAIGYLSE
jgi:hypothetical protein